MWSELGGAARDVVDVVHGRRGRSSAELLGTWLEWSLVDVVDVVRSAARAVRWLARRGSPMVWPAHLMARRG